MKLESKHFFQCILVDRPIVGISTKWYSHMRNLFQNTLKSQRKAIDQNLLHLPKPRYIKHILQGIHFTCSFFNFILEGFFEMGNQKFFYSKFVSFIMYDQIR